MLTLAKQAPATRTSSKWEEMCCDIWGFNFYTQMHSWRYWTKEQEVQKWHMNHHPEAIQQAKAPPTASSGCMFLMRFGKKMRFRLWSISSIANRFCAKAPKQLNVFFLGFQVLDSPRWKQELGKNCQVSHMFIQILNMPSIISVQLYDGYNIDFYSAAILSCQMTSSSLNITWVANSTQLYS